MVKSKYENIYNYALDLGFKIGYIKSFNKGSFYKFTIYKNEFKYNISDYSLEDIKKNIKYIFDNLDKEIIDKDNIIKTKLKLLLNEYSSTFDNTLGNEKELNDLKKYLFINQNCELMGLRILKEKLKKFDYTYCFSDANNTYMYWDKKKNEVDILIELLKPLYKNIIQNYITEFNINKYGIKFTI